MKFPRHEAGLFLKHNEHKDYYQSAQEWIEEHLDRYSWKNEKAKEEAIETNEIWTLHWYPITPIGFYSIAAPTLEDLLLYSSEVEKE